MELQKVNLKNISKIAQDIIRHNYTVEKQEQEVLDKNNDIKEIIDIAKETMPTTPIIRSLSLR